MSNEKRETEGVEYIVETKTVDNSSKAWSGILALIALITGIAAIVVPMKDRLDSMERELTATKTTLQNHISAWGHPGSEGAIDKNEDLIKHVESKIDNQIERNSDVTRQIAKIEAQILFLEKEINRLNEIERK